MRRRSAALKGMSMLVYLSRLRHDFLVRVWRMAGFAPLCSLAPGHYVLFWFSARSWADNLMA